MQRWVILISALVMLAGCSTPAATEPPLTTEPTAEVIEPTTEPTEAPTAEPTEASVSIEPQTVNFPSEDGKNLVGTFFPPSVTPAPGLLLVHQAGVDRSAWEAFTTKLIEQAAGGASYAVLSFDMPGHGESDVPFNNDSGLTAVRSALAHLRSQEGVDADRIVIIGASIGADGAVDECGEGCIGAIALSPGDYLGVPFLDALTALKAAQDPAVLCLAGTADLPSPQTCERGAEAGLSDYQVVLYETSKHGNFLLSAEGITPEPLPMEVVLTWLADHLPLN